MDASSTPTTVIGTTLYSNNTANTSAGATQGTNPIFLSPTDPLFINPANRNFYLAPGSATPDQIIGSVKRGLYVTELIGFGINLVTGDYSRGAVGFWIENGELAYPVEEITIAGNLKDMWLGVETVGNDLVFRGRVASPTVKIAEMTVGGD